MYVYVCVGEAKYMNYSTGVAVTSGSLLFARLLAKYPAHTHTHTYVPLDATFNIYFHPLISAHTRVCMYVCNMYRCVCVCMYVYIHVCMYDCLSVCPGVLYVHVSWLFINIYLRILILYCVCQLVTVPNEPNCRRK